MTSRSSRSRGALAVVLMIATTSATAGACSSERAQAPTERGSTPATVLDEVPNPVAIVLGELEPDEVTVSVGDTVTWISDPIETENHWIVSDEPGEFDSATLEPGNSYQHTFAEPGRYPYFCRIHPGLRGVVTVE